MQPSPSNPEIAEQNKQAAKSVLPSIESLRVYCMVRPTDGAVLMSTAARSPSKCWSKFVWNHRSNKTRRTLESEGWACVKFKMEPFDA